MRLSLTTLADGRRALVLDHDLLTQLGAADAPAFEVTRNGDVIELRPMPLRALTETVMDEHDDTFRKLSR